ncbi:MAG: DUF420 domain-containing protein [Thermoanaerobaculia bacterium]
MSTADLPALNAFLNGTSAVLLSLGYLTIRKKRIAAHRALMVAAVAVSALFLVSYVVYHLQVGSRRFPGTGWVRPVYFSILISHTVLAAAIVPLVLITLARGLRRRHPAHERIARWTLPLWMYVSVTGVVIYFMLYRLYPQ